MSGRGALWARLSSAEPGSAAPLPPARPAALCCSQHEEVYAAAREGRAPVLGPRFAALADQIARITAVGAELGAATLDMRMHMLLSPALAPPPVVQLMQARLRSLTGHAWASLCTVARPAWRAGDVGGGAASGGKGAPPQAPSLAPGDYFRTMVEQSGLDESLEKVVGALAELVEACAGAGAEWRMLMRFGRSCCWPGCSPAARRTAAVPCCPGLPALPPPRRPS